MTGHLLILESLARVLTATGRTMRTVRDRHAVGRTQTAEVPTLHRTGKALTRRRARDIDKLASHEMIRGDFSANRNELVFRHAEFSELHLRFDLRNRKATAFSLRDVLHLGAANAELHGGIAVLVLRAMSHNLAPIELEDGDRNMFTSVCEDAGHADLLCDDT